MSKEKRPIQPEDFIKLSIYSDPQYTHRNAFFYVSTKINDKGKYESHLYKQVLTEEKPTRWTFSGQKNNHPRVSPDGKYLVFQSDRSGTMQIWLLSLAGGEAKQITTFPYGATSPEWSKDGKAILFSARLETDDDIYELKELTKEDKEKIKQEKAEKPLIVNRLKYKSDAQGFHDDKNVHIIRYELEQDSFAQLTSGKLDYYYQDISPDGETLLFAANLNKTADRELYLDLYTLNMKTKEIHKLTNNKGQYYDAHFSPDGKQIVCYGNTFQYDGATLNELIVFDVKTGKERWLSKKWDVQLGDLMIGDTQLGESFTGPVWSNDGSKIFFLGTEHGATHLFETDLTGNRKIVYTDNHHIFSFDYDQNTDSFIMGISTPVNPCNFYHLQDGKVRQITKANEKYVNEVHLSKPEEINFQADDGWDIQGWLLRPYGFQKGKKYPLILEVHGGPHAMYGQTYFHELQLLAAKGYVVLYTNPRGSHGYGQQFVDACRGDYGGKDYTDLMNAVDYVLANYSFIDQDRMGVTGGSYGGFMTNWIVGHTNRFKAAVTQRSISNWLSFYGVSDIGFFFTKWEHGYHLLDDPVKLWNFSPLKYAKNIETPLLILHGELDFRCPIEQGEQLFITLKHLQKEVEFVRFPNANHELSRSGDPNMRIERLNHILRWFKKYI